jgi:peptide/nickel transport system ATP-binding protein
VVTSSPSPLAGIAAPVLTVEDLRVELPIGGVHYPAVDGVSFALEAGRALAVVGESGSGKTQLVRAILGLQPDGARVSGTVRCSGRAISTLSDRDWRAVRGREIGMVFQEPAAALDPVQSIGAQVVEAIRLHEPVSRARARRRAVEALAEVAFPDPERALAEYPHRLSGGLRQRACLAIALASGPKVLLADEPTASLDATVAMQILELLDRLRRERGLAVLLITHDLGVVASHCDRVLVLYAGRVVEEGGTAALLRAPAHPYTRGLLRSVAVLVAAGRKSGERYETIAGALEDLSARRREGCAFAPRCPDRFGPCATSVPELYRAGAGRSRCFLSREGG